MVNPARWRGLRSLIRARPKPNGSHGRRQCFVRYYIASRPVDAEALQDACHLRRRHTPAVMGILRRVTLNMMRTVRQNSGPDRTPSVDLGLRPAPVHDLAFALLDNPVPRRYGDDPARSKLHMH